MPTYDPGDVLTADSEVLEAVVPSDPRMEPNTYNDVNETDDGDYVVLARAGETWFRYYGDLWRFDGVPKDEQYVIFRSPGGVKAWEDMPIGGNTAKEIGRLLADGELKPDNVPDPPNHHHE